VNDRARAYVILQTMGPVAFVFDLSDTTPINPKRDLVPETVTNPFPAKGHVPPGALQNLINACLKFRIIVEAHDFATNLAGNVVRLDGPAFGVALNSKHSEAQRIGTLAHELAHVFCGHLGAVEEGFWPDNREAPKEVREFEAEAVAYLVTDRFGLDIGSHKYLAGYLSDASKLLPNSSLETVLKAVGKIEEMLRGTFRVRRSQRTKAAYARNRIIR
jgi:hypothetical protein